MDGWHFFHRVCDGKRGERKGRSVLLLFYSSVSCPCTGEKSSLSCTYMRGEMVYWQVFNDSLYLSYLPFHTAMESFLLKSFFFRILCTLENERRVIREYFH